MERDKVKETDTIRFMLLFGFFLEYFMLLIDREKRVGILPGSEEAHDFDLIASLIEPTCIRYTLSQIYQNVDMSPFPVVKIHAAVNCLTHQVRCYFSPHFEDILVTDLCCLFVEIAFGDRRLD